MRDEKQRVRGKKWIAQTAYGIKGRKHRKIERDEVLLRTADTARESLWLVYEADGKHCSLYLVKNDERVQMSKEERLCTVGWKTLGSKRISLSVLLTCHRITFSSDAMNKGNTPFKNIR